jgi:hypothetical protein
MLRGDEWNPISPAPTVFPPRVLLAGPVFSPPRRAGPRKFSAKPAAVDAAAPGRFPRGRKNLHSAPPLDSSTGAVPAAPGRPDRLRVHQSLPDCSRIFEPAKCCPYCALVKRTLKMFQDSLREGPDAPQTRAPWRQPWPGKCPHPSPRTTGKTARGSLRDEFGGERLTRRQNFATDFVGNRAAARSPRRRRLAVEVFLGRRPRATLRN